MTNEKLKDLWDAGNKHCVNVFGEDAESWQD